MLFFLRVAAYSGSKEDKNAQLLGSQSSQIPHFFLPFTTGCSGQGHCPGHECAYYLDPFNDVRQGFFVCPAFSDFVLSVCVLFCLLFFFFETRSHEERRGEEEEVEAASGPDVGVACRPAQTPPRVARGALHSRSRTRRTRAMPPSPTGGAGSAHWVWQCRRSRQSPFHALQWA